MSLSESFTCYITVPGCPLGEPTHKKTLIIILCVWNRWGWCVAGRCWTFSETLRHLTPSWLSTSFLGSWWDSFTTRCPWLCPRLYRTGRNVTCSPKVSLSVKALFIPASSGLKCLKWEKIWWINILPAVDRSLVRLILTRLMSKWQILGPKWIGAICIWPQL